MIKLIVSFILRRPPLNETISLDAPLLLGGLVVWSQPIYHICIVCESLIRILNILICVPVCGHRWL